MSHFAELDDNNQVIRVLVCDNAMPNEGYDWLIENLGGKWVQTSYNANFRKRFAGIGDFYNEEIDAFVGPQPFASWTLNAEVGDWVAPVPYPTDGKNYRWNEDTLNWIEIVGE